jgi:hypothetical protein
MLVNLLLEVIFINKPYDNFGTVDCIGVTWLIIWKGGQNRPWVLGTLIYERVKLERGERLV